jgi:hypothetical protein
MQKLVLMAILLAALPAFGQTTQRRLGTSAAALTDTPQTLLSRLPIRVLTFCTILGGAAAETVIFRPVGGGANYASVSVGAGELLARQLQANIPAAGLEVVTSNAAGDVTVECTYRLAPG